MGLLNFLQGFDKFGHSLALTYKGSDKHQTKLGAFITIMIQILVVVQLV